MAIGARWRWAVLDDYSPLRDVTEDMLKNESVLFPVRKTRWYIPKRPLGCGREGCTGSQGDDFFAAPNPPFGAIFTYYLAESLHSSKDARREKEKEREAENESVEFPTWDRIISESLEDEPAIVFTVRDAAGSVVRHIEAPAKSGFHRVAWDLRYPPVNAWVPEEARGDYFPPSAGVLVAPGQFTVSMFKRIDGDQTELGQSQSFDVVSIREPTLPGSSQEQRVVFDKQVHELARAANGTIKTIEAIVGELKAAKELLSYSKADPALYQAANSIQRRVQSERDRLINSEVREPFYDLDEMTVMERVYHARFAPTSAYGPTPSQRESLRIARDLYGDVSRQLSSLIDDEYSRLKAALDAAGVPWSPGRGIQ